MVAGKTRLREALRVILTVNNDCWNQGIGRVEVLFTVGMVHYRLWINEVLNALNEVFLYVFKISYTIYSK